jgi:hypothetical protein
MSENNNIKVELDINEFNFIQQVLGELPSKTGAFMLMTKLKAQADSQGVPPPPADAPT